VSRYGRHGRSGPRVGRREGAGALGREAAGGEAAGREAAGREAARDAGAATHVPPAWDVLGNPLIRKSVRERLRLRPALAWCGATLLVAGLVFAEIFFTLTERGLAGADEAARNAFRGMFVLQALILMLLGTGSVAAGMATEREQGVLDYHRMTPMSPTAKILGYLLGLPVREYAMAATTVPFTVVALWLGRLPVGKVAQLYLVFFTSVWLYHLTGMVAGMVARRPRRANWFTRLIIIALYLFMPRLAAAGFTFLGYLTVMPAFDGLLAREVGWQATTTASLWQQVGFFTVQVPPTLYTLLVQGLLLVALSTIVRRKWQGQANHPFSKVNALSLFGVLQVLVLGSLWPFLTDARLFRVVQHGRVPVEIQWLITLYLFFFVAGIACLLLVASITPVPDTYRRGLRRARKQGRLGLVQKQVRRTEAAEAPGPQGVRRANTLTYLTDERRRGPGWIGGRIPELFLHEPLRPSWRADASPGLLPALGLVGITAVSYLLLFGLALPAEGLRWNPSAGAHLALILLFAGFVLQVHAVSGLWGARGLGLLVGLVWLLPTAIAVILVSAWEAFVPAGYLAATTPVATFAYGLLHLFEPVAAAEPEAQPLLGHLPGLLGAGLVLSLGLGTAGELTLWRQQRAARREVHARENEAHARRDNDSLD